MIERYRLIDYEAAKEGLERAAKENLRVSGASAPNGDPNYRGKHLQLQFTVQDEGVFTVTWTATITYGRPSNTSAGQWPEFVCAENTREAGQRVRQVPQAVKPDF